MIQNAVVDLHILLNGLSSLDLGSALFPLDFRQTYNFANGSGALKATSIFSDKRTLAASASESLDLNGSLTDAFGATLNFTKIRALAIYADPGNTNNVVIGGAGSDPWLGALVGADDLLSIKPGGLLLLVAPDVNGMAVVASTGDLLKVANSSSGSGVTYSIVILGE